MTDLVKREDVEAAFRAKIDRAYQRIEEETEQKYVQMWSNQIAGYTEALSVVRALPAIPPAGEVEDQGFQDLLDLLSDTDTYAMQLRAVVEEYRSAVGAVLGICPRTPNPTTDAQRVFNLIGGLLSDIETDAVRATPKDTEE